LDKPGLVVKFTAQGKPHQLVIGAKVPGDQNYYVLRDQDPHLLTIPMGSKDSLDRQLLALRDKTLLPFILSEVKGLRVKNPKSTLTLEKTDPQTWVWVGRPDFRVRGDRAEKLLRFLLPAKTPGALPKKLTTLDLDPKRRTEITVTTPAGDLTLWLGAKKDDAVYARLGAEGAVVLVDASLADGVGKTLASLEDRRLWSGAIAAVHQAVWGPPGKTWTARKDQGAWKLTGPDQAATQQPAARLEMALWNFQKLEYEKILPPKDTPKGPSAFGLDLLDQDGKPLLHLRRSELRGKTDHRAHPGGKTALRFSSGSRFASGGKKCAADRGGRTSWPSGERVGPARVARLVGVPKMIETCLRLQL
jgi:hypothetical protein